MTRLFHAFIAQNSQKLPAVQIDDLQSFGTMATELARQKGRVRSLAATLSMVSHAMMLERPAQASSAAQESITLYDRIGFAHDRDAAKRAILSARIGQGASPTALQELRDQIAAFLAKKNVLYAGSFATIAYAPLAHDAPDACFRLWAARRDSFGIARRRELETAGLAVPEDLDELARRYAGVTLTDAVEGVLAALDRLIAAGA